MKVQQHSILFSTTSAATRSFQSEATKVMAKPVFSARQGARIGLLMKEEAQDDEGPRRNLNPLHLSCPLMRNWVAPIGAQASPSWLNNRSLGHQHTMWGYAN